MTADEGGGSDDTAGTFLFTARGVIAGVVGLLFPVIFLANLRKGDMEPEMLRLVELDIFDARDPLGGVAKYPFFVDAVPEVVDSWSEKSPSRIFRAASISASVLVIRSRKFFHLWADSACLRKVSPFFVTRSRTPLSMIERTFDVAGI